MNLKGALLKPNSHLNSGRVKCFTLPDKKTRITQITTFCPDIIGPGPTHVYLIENDTRILMDIGIPTQLAKLLFYHYRHQKIPPEVAKLPYNLSEQQLIEGLKLAKCSVKDIDALVISHGHPDHFLLGRSIVGQGIPQVIAHILDTPEISSPWGLLRHWISRRQSLLVTGMPLPNLPIEDFIGDMDLESHGFSLKVDSPIFRDGLLRINGSSTEEIQVKHLPGHSPGSIGLIVGASGQERVLLCGDSLLYPITPIPDDLLTYLRTLQDLKKLNNITLVLPAHGKVIKNLKARVEFLEKHHRRRLRLTYEICKEIRSVWEIATTPNFFNIYIDPNKFNPLAGMEALVHVELLMLVGGLFRSYIRDGIHFFQNSGEAFEDVYDRVSELVKGRKITPIMRY